MTSKELVKQALEKWKFPILDETDNTLVFKYQLNFIHVTSLSGDTKSMAAVLPGIFSADDEHKRILALKAANELNFKMMQAKFYLDDDNDMTVSAEFFYEEEEAVESLLKTALQSLVTGKRRFKNQYKETENEDKFLQELDEE